ncbi:Flagellar M-ring protein [Roseovarius sp. THAF9]|uniref:flagellar basal-body MS-ring/collar protein FliF n=1 Tax=Roseovarius sp. THAF9 TaxID=2587847 RepID=UPI0012684162|nr:flagellar basal-body MS-ring/collar protein FliF [Roseovarius sp. THAF9]QFT95144.1 Flagellar M-ring protein [Roseovarius sp. THAF9]
MQQLIDIWSGMNARRRVIVTLATVAMFAAVLSLARMASAPSLSLIYAGLESGPAGEVVRALEQRGVAYDVRGGSIFVDSARRDELRMTLASEGLPANSSRGYELLDGLSGFGTTSQMFDAAYWRAKEGELARTILTHPSISSARVHIAKTGNNPFQRDVQPSASVSISTASGGLSAKHAKGLKFLVASAVPGLTPEDVSIIDSEGGLLGMAEETPTNAADDRTDAIRQRVTRLLEARVGPGNAVVEVSVDTVTQTESVRERVIDPGSRVAISTDTEEVANQSTDQGGGDVTVASNLPDGDGAAGDSSSSQVSETRERINYEVSETERQITMVPGAVKRLTVAVLVNGTTTTDANGEEVFEPRSEEELADLRELVASAVGFDEARGDEITLKTMQFELPEPLGTGPQSSFLSNFAFDAMSLIKAAVLAIVALILGLFVVRPVLARQPDGAAQLAAPAGSENSGYSDNIGDFETSQAALTGEIQDDADRPGELPMLSGGGGMGLPSLDSDDQDPVERLRAMISERQDETVEILRSWLEGEEERA